MKPILTAKEMKQYDASTIESGTPSLELMERAARAVFELLLEEFDTTRVLVCCGGGNNGGDGLAVARLLRTHGIDVSVCYLGALDDGGAPDTAHMSAECRAELAMLPRDVEITTAVSLVGVSAVVDAIFGIGLTRAIGGRQLAAIKTINEAKVPVLAIDIPSGIDADSGRVMGGAIAATKTLAIAAKKYGHLLFPGAQLSGEVRVADIGIAVGKVAGHVLEREDLALLPPRPRRAHKGSFGRVLIVGGSPEMSGAALLAAKAAYRAGAGLVELLIPEENRLITAVALPEAILTCYNEENAVRKLEDALARADAVAIGMGLSQSETAKGLVRHTLQKSRTPLVIDADALNLIAADPALRATLYLLGNAILTPHLAEMSRLMARSVAEIGADLPEAAGTLARESGKTVVLKDAHTVIAAGEQLYFNRYGNSGMATGGSGDVLAGVIASFAAQGAALTTAATCGVLAHALAGDAAREAHGNHGVMASDIIEGLCHVLS